MIFSELQIYISITIKEIQTKTVWCWDLTQKSDFEKSSYMKIIIYQKSNSDPHSVKSVQVQSFFWSVFSCIWTECGDLLRQSQYSVQIQENNDQKKLCIWTYFKHCLNGGLEPNGKQMVVT